MKSLESSATRTIFQHWRSARVLVFFKLASSVMCFCSDFYVKHRQCMYLAHAIDALDALRSCSVAARS